MSDRYSMRMNDIEFYKNNIYFSAMEFNGLYSVDINGGQAKFIGAFPEEEDKAKDLHSIIIRYENELAFFPGSADNICVYNLDNGMFTNFMYPINENYFNSTNGRKAATAILIDHEVYIFGDNNPGVFTFDFLTKEIKICEKWFEKVKEYGLVKRDSYFCEDIARIGNSIFTKLRKSNFVVEYNIRNEQFWVHTITKRDYPVINCVLASADEKLWMLYTDNEDKKVIGWNCQGGIKEIDCGEEVRDLTLAYEYSVVSGREIWFFPYPLDLPILIFNLDTEEIRTMYLNRKNEYLKDGVGECVWFRKMYHNNIFFHTVRGNKLYCLAQDEQPRLCTDIYIDRREFTNKVYDAKQMLYEYKNEWVSGPCIEDLIGLCLIQQSHARENVNGKFGALIERFVNKGCYEE